MMPAAKAKQDHGPVRAALEETIASDRRLAEKRNAALVALARLLASQVDESGADASNRLTAAYLSALKDVDRALGDRKPSGGAAGGNQGGGALGRLQSITGGKSA